MTRRRELHESHPAGFGILQMHGSQNLTAAINPRPYHESEALRVALQEWRTRVIQRHGPGVAGETLADHGSDVIRYEEHLIAGGAP